MADQEITCSDCWPKICRCHKGPLPKAYIEWAGAGFWFEGTVMRRDDGTLVFIGTDGKAFLVERFMQDDAAPTPPSVFYPPYQEAWAGNGGGA